MDENTIHVHVEVSNPAIHSRKRMEEAVTFHVPGATSWTLGQGPATASITATLHGMYLGLWGRSNLADTATIEGDADLALRVLQGVTRCLTMAASLVLTMESAGLVVMVTWWSASVPGMWMRS